MKKILFSIFLLPLLLFQTFTVHSASAKGKIGLLPIGSSAPDFRLTDVVTEKTVSLSDFAEKKVLVVMILCRHCPFVQRVKTGIADLAKDYANSEVGLVAICASDPIAYPMDAPQSLKEMALQEGFVMPFLFDETQKVAQAYTAIATPDFFVFDKQRRLIYRGQLDDARPDNNAAVTGRDVRAAIASALVGVPFTSSLAKPAVGCSIKWKKGNEPAYWQ